MAKVEKRQKLKCKYSVQESVLLQGTNKADGTIGGYASRQTGKKVFNELAEEVETNYDGINVADIELKSVHPLF